MPNTRQAARTHEETVQDDSTIEDKLMRVINGHDLGDITPDLCDYSLEEQYATSDAQGVLPSSPPNFVPTVGKSVSYIVATVIINHHEEILMMQEAKESCAGKWYLPAGRMEKGESVVEAAVREVHEETGLKANITTLLAIESAGGTWFRFVVTGNIIGGTLKTPAQADGESLQAKWVANIKELPLRGNDIFNIIDIAREHKSRATNTPHYWHADILPAQRVHHRNYIRIVAVIRKRSTNTLHVLISERNRRHFPIVEIHPQRSLHASLRKFMIELFGAELPQHRPHGLLNIEHWPKKIAHTSTDGMCFNLLVVFRPPLEDVSLIGKCAWHELSKPREEKLELMLNSKYSTLPLNVVR